MTTKAVIDIDVNDAKFTRFKDLFDAYQKQLAKTPGQWKDADKQVQGISSHFAKMAETLATQAEAARTNDDEDKHRVERLKTSEKLWTSIGKSSGALAKNVLDVGVGVLKWGGLLAGGLVGGALWGLEHVASGAADQRRSSLGLGLSTGEQTAFGTNMSRFVDPHAFLSGINSAASNISQQGPLYGIGVDPNQSTAKVAIDTLKAVRSLALATPINQLGILESSRNLSSLGISTEDLRRLRSASPGEFNKQLSHFQTDVKALGFSDKTGQAWQDFTSQMERAGNTIFKVLVQRLEPLAPSLTKLSDSVVHVIERFANGGAIQTAIESLGKYLDGFAGTIGKPEFLKKVEIFATDVGALGDAFHGIANFAKNPLQWDLTSGQDIRLQGLKTLISGIGSGVGSAWDSTIGKWSAHAKINTWENRLNLPHGIGDVIWGRESSQSFNPADQPGANGAQGPFQIKPSMGGGADLHDFDSAMPQAMKILAAEIAHYHGDTLKGIAAYHLGDPALDKIISQYGNKWASHVPYVTGIKIENATGGNVVVSASQLTQ